MNTMATYLFATVGGSDVQFKKEASTIDNKLCRSDRTGNKTTFFLNPREGGKIIFDNFSIWRDKLEYPIIDPVKQYLDKNNNKPDKIFLFVSDQASCNTSDTVYFGEILKKHLEEEHYDCEIFELIDNPISFDEQYDRINKYFEEHEKEIDAPKSRIFVLPQTGTPATRNALLLNCILYFPHTKQLNKPKGGDVTQQHFPQRFREQVKERSLPSILKETLATLSARNLSHTDGSHVLPSYQKNLNKALDSLQESITGEKINENKEKYNAFESYLRGQMEYLADLSGQTSSQTFFDYDFKTVVDTFQHIINSFLGKGLIDDQKYESYDVAINLYYVDGSKTVSIPGGSNGINAFYTILKNFIRNLYKHSSPGKNEDDDSMSYFVFLQLDNDERFHNYYKVTLWDNKDYTAEELTKIIQGAKGRKGISSCIHDKLLHKDGAVRDYGWGILEMKIAAFYLIGLPLEYFDEPVNGKIEIDIFSKEIFPKPLEVVKHGSHLAYEFYLRKPETFCVVTDKKPDNEAEYHNSGITFCTGEFENLSWNTRAKFIIHNYAKYDFPKNNNVRTIYDPKNDYLGLLDKNTRDEAIKKWLEKLLPASGQNLTDFTKIDLDLGAQDDLSNDQIKLLQGENLIVIDSHGYGHSRLTFKAIKEKKYFYYSAEPSKHKEIGRGTIDELRAEEIEAIFTKVAILDERIQDKVQEVKTFVPMKLSKQELLELRGIFVPLAEGDENAFSLKSLFGNKTGKEEVETFKEKIKGLMKAYHYTVLHFTLLEKMAEVMETTIDDYYQELVQDSNNGNYLILDSGKGIPSTLPERSYFINFSTMEHDINTLSKVSLVQHLNAVRIHHKPHKS